MKEPLWRIGLLGRLCLERDGELITHFRTRKAGALLAFLAYHSRQSHPREALIERFWSDIAQEAARNNFRVTLNLLRRRLEPSGVAPGSVLLADRAHVQIHPAASTTDVAEFEAALQAVQHATLDVERVTVLSRAVDLYAGDLLPGYDDWWVVTERQRLSDAYLGALRQLIKLLAQAREFDRAIGFARRAITVDPLREESHRHLMRLYAAVGRPAAALQQYGELQRVLTQELSTEPSATTRELAMQLGKAVGEGTSSCPSLPNAGLSLLPTPHSLTPPSAVPAYTDLLHNLPPTWNRFFGREEELHQLRALLLSDSVRLVTLTGTAGAGKTRLSIEAVRQIVASSGNTACFVSLAEVSCADQIATAILHALRVTPSHEIGPLEQIARIFPRREGGSSVLILDNFEHLVEEGALIVRTLLAQTSSLTCLVTSRQRLQIEGEQEFVLLPMPTPVAGGSPERLMEFASVQLFAACAQEARRGFRLTTYNAAAVAALCERLEGLPLSIELAAASADMLTPAQMLSRLSDRLGWLAGHHKDLSPRHRTLRHTLAWSYRLLPPGMQRLFAAISVFRGGWTLEAVEAVVGTEETEGSVGEPVDTVAILRQLRDRSLIFGVEVKDEMRFRMLETMREFAAEQLGESDRQTLAQRHSSYFLRLAEEAGPHLTGPDQSRWLDRLDVEHDNLRAALTWSQSEAETGVLGVRLATTLWRFWEVRGHVREGRGWVKSALSRQTDRDGSRAKLLQAAATLANIDRDYATSSSYMEECVEIYEELGDRRGVSTASIIQAIIAKHQGNYQRAHLLLTESLKTWRDLKDTEKTAITLLNMGGIAWHQGDYAAARQFYEESLAMHSELGNNRFVAFTLMQLGAIALQDRYFDAARALYEESLRIVRELGDERSAAVSLLNLGNIAFEQRNHARAHALCEESLSLFRNLGDQVRIANFLEVMSSGAWLQDRPDRTLRLAAAAQALRKSLGAPLVPFQQADQETYLLRARAAMSTEACAEAEAHGRAMTLEQAMAYALQASQEEVETE